MSLPQFQKKKRVQNISYEYQAKNLKEEAKDILLWMLVQ